MNKFLSLQKYRHPDAEQDVRPNMPIISWQEQFMTKEVKTSCDLKMFCADYNLEANKIFVSFDNITMSPHLKHLRDVIVQFKGDNKVALIFKHKD